jgi:enamine deaminase RidA (YjgF/YER057c/UK114 family)
MAITRTTILSGYPFEERYGYARAVRVGPHVFVSGTTARTPHLEANAYVQMAAAIAGVAVALRESGAELRHVVRTVVYATDRGDADHIARAHQEAFGASPPASTPVQVTGLTQASALVEIEVTAFVHD